MCNIYSAISSVLYLSFSPFPTSLSLPLSFPPSLLPPPSLLQDHLDDLLRQLIGLLSSSDINIVTCSVGVLCNLTCNNPKNKTIVCQLRGVEVMEGRRDGGEGRERRRKEGEAEEGGGMGGKGREGREIEYL